MRIELRSVFCLVSALLLAAIVPITATAKSNKIEICHAPPGNPARAKTIRVGERSVESHLSNHRHDVEGSCPQTELVCDDGIDNNFDGQVDCDDSDCAITCAGGTSTGT